MILSDDEMLQGVKAEQSAMLFYARAIEAKVLEKLSDKLLDAKRLDFVEKEMHSTMHMVGNRWYWSRGRHKTYYGKPNLREAIDAAIKEMK